ncbi:MAG: hypothetical protein M1299_03470 [Firmicutes bacterium]|nr:hypothetical protein [Bacillota bacterium]MCL5038876.1 hypothetical protein [Bacillota bacterium]
MQYKGYRIPVVLLSLAITVTLLAGVALLSEYTLVRLPLIRTLQGIEGVQEVRLERGAKGDVILVRLASVADLRKTYGQLYQKALSYEKSAAFSLRLLDNRDQALEKTYYRLNFSLQEALATGQFSRLRDELDRLDQTLDRAQAEIDGDYVYLQLHQGQNYLYEVVPRQAQVGSQVSKGGLWP